MLLQSEKRDSTLQTLLTQIRHSVSDGLLYVCLCSFLARPLGVEGDSHSSFLQSSPGLIRSNLKEDGADETDNRNPVFWECAFRSLTGPLLLRAAPVQHLIPP